jgi:vacuolar-type H+-ATPase subunit I/STV1
MNLSKETIKHIYSNQLVRQQNKCSKTSSKISIASTKPKLQQSTSAATEHKNYIANDKKDDNDAINQCRNNNKYETARKATKTNLQQSTIATMQQSNICGISPQTRLERDIL